MSWWLLAPLVAWAHDPGISTAEVQWKESRIEIVNGFAPDDAKQFLPSNLRGDERWDAENFPDVQPALEEVAGQLWEVRVGGTAVAPTERRVRLLPGDNVSFELVYPILEDATEISLQVTKLAQLPAGHRQFVIVSDARGSTLTKKLMRAGEARLIVRRSGSDPTSSVSTGESTTSPTSAADVQVSENQRTFLEFLRLGVEHIWKGFDHLLFLFALLVVCRSFRSIVAIVSCFTIAHSITLGMATLDIVNLPARLVEPAIAASIVFVGVENLLRRGEEPRGRWILTFVFGLIHGFGFASVLRDLGVGRASGEGIAMPLLSFNLGVELGQIAIAALVLPLVWWLRKREWFVRRGVPLLSAIVALAGLYWLLERTVLA